MEKGECCKTIVNIGFLLYGLMALLSKVLPLTASCLAQVHNPSWEFENVASDLGLGSGLSWVLRFPPPVTTGQSRLSLNMAEKVIKSEIPTFSYKFSPICGSHDTQTCGQEFLSPTFPHKPVGMVALQTYGTVKGCMQYLCN